MTLDFGDIGGQKYSCFLDNLSIWTPDVIIDGIDGEHLREKSFHDVKGIKIVETNFHFFPKNIGKFFENIEVVEVRNSSLQVLTNDDLEQFPNLEVLWLEQNMLQSLDKGLLRGNPKLKDINFSGNQIKFFSSDILKSKHLEKVNLSNNVCIKIAEARTRNEIEKMRWKIVSSCQSASGSSKNANPVIVTSVLTLIALFARCFVV